MITVTVVTVEKNHPAFEANAPLHWRGTESYSGIKVPLYGGVAFASNDGVVKRTGDTATSAV